MAWQQMEGPVDHTRRDPDVVDLAADSRKGAGPAVMAAVKVVAALGGSLSLAWVPGRVVP
jgi:hypothetical protein